MGLGVWPSLSPFAPSRAPMIPRRGHGNSSPTASSRGSRSSGWSGLKGSHSIPRAHPGRADMDPRRGPAGPDRRVGGLLMSPGAPDPVGYGPRRVRGESERVPRLVRGGGARRARFGMLFRVKCATTRDILTGKVDPAAAAPVTPRRALRCARRADDGEPQLRPSSRLAAGVRRQTGWPFVPRQEGSPTHDLQAFARFSGMSFA